MKQQPVTYEQICREAVEEFLNTARGVKLYRRYVTESTKRILARLPKNKRRGKK